jgi:hypothetical protein
MTGTQERFAGPTLLAGFLIWLLASLAFRVRGQFFFITEDRGPLVALYAGVSVVTFKRLALKGLEKVAAGVLLVLPGMTIDTFVIHFFADVFPNMPASRATSFGSWLMWASSVVLLTSVFAWSRERASLRADVNRR